MSRSTVRKEPEKSYLICCNPRSGSHLLADGLTATGIAGKPVERFPRFSEQDPSFTSEQADEWVTVHPPNAPFDEDEDRAYIEKILEDGMSENGVFGLNLHWFQFADAIKRLSAYTGNGENDDPKGVFENAFPNLSYIWLRRRDRIAQAVSWYKAILTLQYYRMEGDSAKKNEEAELVFNYKKIQTYLSALQNGDNGWLEYFSSRGIEPIVVEYEDFIANYAGTIRRVMEGLGLGSGDFLIPQPRHIKTADDLSRIWVEKFRHISKL